MKITTQLLGDSLQKTDEWISELVRIGGFASPQQAYSVLHTVLQTLRDRLTVEEAAQLGAQFPLIIRGIYYEGWRPARTPDPVRSREQFLSELSRLLGNSTVGPEDACRAVFELLERRISPGEIEDVKGLMHHRLRDLWPAPARAD